MSTLLPLFSFTMKDTSVPAFCSARKSLLHACAAPPVVSEVFRSNTFMQAISDNGDIHRASSPQHLYHIESVLQYLRTRTVLAESRLSASSNTGFCRNLFRQSH